MVMLVRGLVNDGRECISRRNTTADSSNMQNEGQYSVENERQRFKPGEEKQLVAEGEAELGVAAELFR